MIDFIHNTKYLQMLTLMGRLSNLFAKSPIPYIHYRVTENLFCKYFQAIDLSRSDIAYDAKMNDIGIGIKTFQLQGLQASEKVAEFNTLASTLKTLSGETLARQIALHRNERMEFANRLCDITHPIYHIIGRSEKALQIFNSEIALLGILSR